MDIRTAINIVEAKGMYVFKNPRLDKTVVSKMKPDIFGGKDWVITIPGFAVTGVVNDELGKKLPNSWQGMVDGINELRALCGLKPKEFIPPVQKAKPEITVDRRENYVPPEPKGKFPKILPDAQAIAAYIDRIAGDETNVEAMHEFFNGFQATLRLIKTSDLTEGDAASNLANASREARYAKLNPDNAPPLVVKDGKILDGNHRFRIGVKRGQIAFWCYDVTPA